MARKKPNLEPAAGDVEATARKEAAALSAARKEAYQDAMSVVTEAARHQGGNPEVIARLQAVFEQLAAKARKL